VLHRSEYLPAEDEVRLLTIDEHGMPTGYLRRVADRLVLTPDSDDQAMVNPKSTTLYRLGLFSFSARGTSYYKKPRLGLGKPVRLVRQPGNVHDKNAIGLYTSTGTDLFGHVNKQNAARLAKLIDKGDKFAGICVRASGSSDLVPMILVAREDVLDHLKRKL
jgi:hypothetical protein